MEQKGLAMDLWEKRLEDYLAEYTLPYGAEHNLNRVFRVLKLSAAWPDFVKLLEKSREECRVVFDAYPCTCTCEKVEAYVKAFGFTDADIAKFRSIMLED